MLIRGREVIGLVPAAGKAARLGSLPCSKELYPIGFRKIDENGGVRCKVICHHLLESMCSAGVAKAYIILRQGKWDIPAYLGSGGSVGLNLAYLTVNHSSGVPFTLDQAYPFVKDAYVALGFPDIIHNPADPFSRLFERLERSDADLVLGLFPSPNPSKMDMVELDGDGRVCGIQIKPMQTHLHFTWIVAVWSPTFTHFMHDYLTPMKHRSHQPGGELFVSDVILAAMESKLAVDSVSFPSGDCLDVGTPEDLVRATREMQHLQPIT